MAYRGTIGDDDEEVLLARVSGINAKTTGSTALYTVPTDLNALITRVYFKVTSVSALVTPAILSLGKSGALTDWIVATSLPAGLNAAGKTVNAGTLSAGLTHSTYTGGDVFSMNITVGAVCTSMTLEVFVFGLLHV